MSDETDAGMLKWGGYQLGSGGAVGLGPRWGGGWRDRIGIEILNVNNGWW